MGLHPRINPADRRTIGGWREHLLMTQLELARKAHVSKNAVYFWESGRHMPRITTRLAIAEVFAEFGIGLEQIIWPAEEVEQAGQKAADVAAKHNQAS